MKIQQKIIGLIVASFSLMLIFLLFYSYLASKQRNIHYDSIAESKMAIIQNIIRNQQNKLDQLVNDYSSWDDMVEYIKNPKRPWETSNIDGILDIYQADHLWIYTPQLDCIASRNSEKSAPIDTLPIPKKEIPSLFTEKKNVRFFLSINQHILQIFAGKVVGTSEYSEEKDSRQRGYFFVAKWWDKAYLDQLSTYSDADIQTIPASAAKSKENYLTKNRDFSVSVSIPLLDHKRNVIRVINFRNELSSISKWNYLEHLMIATGIGVLLATILLSFLLVNRWMSRPLKRISKTLKTGDISHLGPPPFKTDEFGTLSQLITSHFEIQNRLLLEVENHKATQKILQDKEESLGLLINNINDIVWTMDLDLKVTFITPSVKQHTQYSVEEFYMLRLEQLFLPASREGAMTFFLQLKENITAGHYSCTDNEHTEQKIRCKDGTPLWVSINAKPLVDNRGNVQGIHGTITNIDNYKKAIEDAASAHEEVVKASSIKSQFMANMSHEIRTPLNGIIGMTDLVLNTELKESQQIYIHHIKQSANVLCDIVNDILDFSKIEAGKMQLADTLFSLSEIVSLALNTFSAKCELKGVEISCYIDPRLPDTLYGDSIRLKQTILNIFGNATKFTDKGEIELAIVPADDHFDPLHPLLLFSVRDTGIGITKDKIDDIFESFSQIDVGLSKKHEGTGLGLTISKKLVEMMNGEIWAESEMGVGSTFFFKIPFTSKELPDTAPPNPSNIQKVGLFNPNNRNMVIIKKYLDFLNIENSFHASTPATENIAEIFADDQVIVFDFPFSLLDYDHKVKTINQLVASRKKVLILSSPSTFEKTKKSFLGDPSSIYHLSKPYTFHTFCNFLESMSQTQTIPTKDPNHDSSGTFFGKTVLVAEDNRVNMVIIREMLKKLNLNVLVAENGQEAIEKLLNNPVDFIFMDIHMPVMDGAEATIEIRKLEIPEKRQVPIVALTADAMPEDRKRCLSLGMNDYITKPYTQATIINCLNDFIH